MQNHVDILNDILNKTLSSLDESKNDRTRSMILKFRAAEIRNVLCVAMRWSDDPPVGKEDSEEYRKASEYVAGCIRAMLSDSLEMGGHKCHYEEAVAKVKSLGGCY
jgi:hypothetical protein